MNYKNIKIDVLSVIDNVGEALRVSEYVTLACEVENARDVIAELVEAARAATEDVIQYGFTSREKCDRLIAAVTMVTP